MHTIEPEQIETEKLYQDMGLTDEEYEQIKQVLQRRPNYTETGIFSVMWSEHCSYKSSKPLLKTLPSEGKRVIFGPGEGAGVVDIDDNQAVVFKMESHNSPSYVDPFQGAATGVGGIVRDVFSMGARPIALLNSLRFGSYKSERTKEIVSGVLEGMANYGNALEVPTVHSDIQFDDSYEENPLINAMCVGLIDQEHIQTGVAKGVGNVVIYAGGETGRDGIHGATFSSDEIEEGDEHTSAVAIGNPEIKKRLIEACLEVTEHEALVGMQDMGAAGLTSSASEMASKAGTGMELMLDYVPQREKNMSAYEIMLSESQERMLLVVEQGKEEEILHIFEKYDVPAAVIGKVIEEKAFRIIHQEKVWADVPVDALDEDAPVYHLPSKEPVLFKENQKKTAKLPKIEDISTTFKEMLKRPTIADKQNMYSQFKGNALLGLGNNVGIVQVAEDKAIAITANSNSRYIKLDPKRGGEIAVAEATRHLVASGAEPLALTDGLNYGNPTKEEVFWELEQSIAGLKSASLALDTPVVSGNVSLYNQSKGEAIFPTPIIGMVGLIKSLNDITTHVFKEAGDRIYVIGEAKEEFAGSEIQHMLTGMYEGKISPLDLSLEKERQDLLLQSIRQGVIESTTPISTGGLAIALAKSVLPTDLGIDVHLNGDEVVQLFSESQSRFLITVKEENREQFEERFPDTSFIGKVTEDGIFSVTANEKPIIQEEIVNLQSIWESTFEKLFTDGE